MTFFNVVLVVLVVIVVWSVWHARKVTDAKCEEESWLPLPLRGATLKFSERKFFDDGLYPLVAQVDRAYLTANGETILVDFKRRSTKRAFESDMVELSAQRVVLLANGVKRVSRFAYVVVVDPLSNRNTPIEIELEGEQEVRARQRRFIRVRNGEIAPSSTNSASVCRQCGHRNYCDKVIG